MQTSSENIHSSQNFLLPSVTRGSSSGLTQRPSFPPDRQKVIWLLAKSQLSVPLQRLSPYFSSRNLSPTLPFQKLRPHSPHHKLKIPLLHLEAKFPTHALLARSTHPLTEAEPQFWLQRSPDATQTTSCFSHLSWSLLLHPEARSSELSLEVRSTPLLLEAKSGLWLHRQSLALTWEAAPLLSLQRMRTHCWPQRLSPHFGSRV